MMLKWFNAREARGRRRCAGGPVRSGGRSTTLSGAELWGRRKEHATPLQELHEQADREVRTLQLNFYQKARFANSLSMVRLIENGVESRRGPMK